MDQVKAEMAAHAVNLARLFKAGAKVTILVRNPAVDDGDVVTTDDDLRLAIVALRRLAAREEREKLNV